MTEGIGLRLARTSALATFRQLLGHTNHDLITLLVGIQGIKSGRIEKPADFNVAWNPQSLRASAVRAEQFARKATLVWVVDALDAYLTVLRRASTALADPALHGRLVDQSVARKFDAVLEQLQFPLDARVALVQLAINWRNNLAHFGSRSRLEPAFRNFLTKHAESIRADYRHLDAAMLLDGFDRNRAPRLKEVSSLVQATFSLVSDFDALLMQRISIPDYAEGVLRAHFHESEGHLESIWNVAGEKRTKKLTQLLLSNGFVATDSIENPGALPLEYLEEIAGLSFAEAKGRFLNGATSARVTRRREDQEKDAENG